MKSALVPKAQSIKQSIQKCRKATLIIAFPSKKQFRAHHWRQRKRNKSGDENRAGERKRKFTKQGAGNPRDKPNRGINGRKRNRHCDHRPRDFPRTFERSLMWCHTFFDMTVNIFNNNNCVVNDETYGQHQCQERQEID